MTMGIVPVATLAEGATSPPSANIRSGLIATSSPARLRSRSGLPSAYRYSITIFCDSVYPKSRRPRRNAPRVGIRGSKQQHADALHPLALLSAQRERPCYCRTACKDEWPPSNPDRHVISSGHHTHETEP